MDKEDLQYSIEDSTIADLLGRQNFSNKESAVLELVKNAFDARATEIIIKYSSGKLIFVDSGDGMNKDDILGPWMHVGKSAKGYTVSNDGTGARRVAAGSKGIGRFALARLGSHAVLSSKKKGHDAIKWETDWNRSWLTSSEKTSIGTYITISDLRDRWTEKTFSKLADYLSITYNDDVMSIQLLYENKRFNVRKYYGTASLGINCVSQLNLSYRSEDATLLCSITSDEFLKNAQVYCPDISLNNYHEVIYIPDELEGDSEFELSAAELLEKLEVLGDFEAELYFSLKSSTREDVQKFMYKHASLSNRYEKGVVLYRNSFSISAYEGRKDWLGLGKRARISPAAATHDTGSWRVRENQLSGKVIIDKRDNCELRDLSNRQGLDENEYYELFQKIIISGISVFERYRQSIIRTINKKNSSLPKPTSGLIKQAIKDPRSIAKFSSSEQKTFINEIKQLQEDKEISRSSEKDAAEKHRYDVRILNVFATTGLKASSIAHELRNDRNDIAECYDCIVDALKTYGFWDELLAPNRTEFAYQNVPELLLRNRNISQKVLVFLDTMLDESEKKKFEIEDLCVHDVVNALADKWMKDNAAVSIVCELDADIVFPISEDILSVVFDNLILNSIQQNETSSLKITIEIDLQDGMLCASYRDDGKGLAPKYRKDPYRILEVHETSRKNGHGLGMWMVNNTIKNTSGEILDIYKGDRGFGISFCLGRQMS